MLSVSHGFGAFGVACFGDFGLRGGMAKNQELEATKRLMGALGRMPPKPHSDMKLGKPGDKTKESPAMSKQASINRPVVTKRRSKRQIAES